MTGAKRILKRNEYGKLVGTEITIRTTKMARPRTYKGTIERVVDAHEVLTDADVYKYYGLNYNLLPIYRVYDIPRLVVRLSRSELGRYFTLPIANDIVVLGLPNKGSDTSFDIEVRQTFIEWIRECNA